MIRLRTPRYGRTLAAAGQRSTADACDTSNAPVKSPGCGRTNGGSVICGPGRVRGHGWNPRLGAPGRHVSFGEHRLAARPTIIWERNEWVLLRPAVGGASRAKSRAARLSSSPFLWIPLGTFRVHRPSEVRLRIQFGNHSGYLAPAPPISDFCQMKVHPEPLAIKDIMKREGVPSDETIRLSPEKGSPEQALGSDNYKLILLTGVLLAMVLRYPLLPFESGDYPHFEDWYDFIVENGGFAALQYDVSTYNVPLLYLIAASSVLFPEFPKIFILKGISVVFDFALAFFVYKCVSFKYHRRREATQAALATLFAPTVVLNAAMWGQWDAIYTTFLVACLYFLLTRRQAVAFIAFGLAVSFKLQAIFLAPLFLWLFVKKKVNIQYFLLAPLCWFSLLLPAWLVGRPFGELLLIYANQASEHPFLTMAAPNLYQWISNDYYHFYPAGMAFTVGIAVALAVVVYKSRAKITADRLIFFAFFSVLLSPYVLPKMHDRYFFPADVIAIIFAFYWPRYWYAPIVVGLTSLVTYIRFLAGGVTILPLSWLAAVLLIFIGVLGRQFFHIFGKDA